MKNFLKIRKSDKDFRCGSCGLLCVKTEISQDEMDLKVKKLVEMKHPTINMFGLNVKDWDDLKKIEKVNSVVFMIYKMYDYYKCQCGWGFLHKKDTNILHKTLKELKRDL